MILKSVRATYLRPFWLPHAPLILADVNLNFWKAGEEIRDWPFWWAILTTLTNCYKAFTPNIYLSKGPIPLIHDFSHEFLSKCTYGLCDQKSIKKYFVIIRQPFIVWQLIINCEHIICYNNYVKRAYPFNTRFFFTNFCQNVRMAFAIKNLQKKFFFVKRADLPTIRPYW